METESEGLRTRNMQARRIRILAEARRLLVAGGIDALNLRDLAQAAGVTVPTIYNLIGSKEDLLAALFTNILDEVASRIADAHAQTPLEVAEALVIQSASIFAEDENYYRSAFLAIDYLHRLTPGQASVVRLYAQGDQLLIAGIAACRDAGLLCGDVAPHRLATLVSRSFNENLRDWAAGLIPLAAFREGALADMYIALASDACPAFRAQLIKKLNTLNADLNDSKVKHDAI